MLIMRGVSGCLRIRSYVSKEKVAMGHITDKTVILGLLYTDKSPSKRGGEWSTVPSTAMAISYDTLDLSKSICWSLGND